ncbi:MAG: hypothetical protein ACYC8T_21810 [Myxococcaceae bacterium]
MRLYPTLLVVLFTAAAPALAQAQAEVNLLAPPPLGEMEERKTLVITLDPLRVMGGQVVGKVEKAFTGNLSALVGMTLSTTAMPGVGMSPGVNYYFNGDAPSGLWAGPRLAFEVQRHDPLGRPRLIGAGGVEVGYSKVFRSGLTLGIGAGVLAGYDNFGPPRPGSPGTYGLGVLGGPPTALAMYPGVGTGRGAFVGLTTSLSAGWAF